MEGWVRLHRRLMDHPFWPVGRRYTNLEAWLYLILSANHKPAIVNFDFDMIPVARGQILTSQVRLAKKWEWHRETIAKFLRMLEREKMVVIETSNKTSSGYTLITIQNYDSYQGGDRGDTDSQTDSGSDRRAAAKRQPSGTNNNDNNEKNEKRGQHLDQADSPESASSKRTGNRSPHVSIPDDLRSTVSNIISKLNELAGRAYQTDSKAIMKYLRARLKAGKTQADCLAVVEDRWAKWSDSEKMRQHFNPVTLFREENFDRYLAEAQQSRRTGNGSGPLEITELGDGIVEIDGLKMTRKDYERKYGPRAN